MALRRVIAQYMHDSERDAALALCDTAEVQGHVIVGEVEEDRLQELQDTGVFVTVADEPPESVDSPAGTFAPPPRAPELGLSGAPTRGARPPVALDERPTPAPVDIWVVQLAGPILDRWREALADAGCELIERLEGHQFSARLQLEAVPAVRQLPFVLGVRLYTAADTVAETTLSARRGARESAASGLFEVLVHRAEELEGVHNWLDERGLEVHGGARRKLRFAARPGAAVLGELAKLPAVAAVDEFVPPRFSNDRARRILGLDPPDDTLPAAIELTGDGQVVAVADSGIDEHHPDLRDHLVGVVALGRPGDASDPHGHGTHVAGSVLGDGSKSGGAVRGMAPEAQLFFQSIMDAGGGLGGLPVDLGDLFEEAYQAGARIHNNSWGAAAASAYRVNCLEVDEYVAAHPDMLVVVAAGNGATAAQPRYTTTGSVDLFSVDAPATAKNALTVGATRADRMLDDAPTWGQWWPDDFPPPLGDQMISGDPEAMAAFSGRGPCHEQTRMKPDLVAPGTFILSTRSTNAPAGNFWGEGDLAGYAFMGGTSMATPLVSGCAALVRQYFVQQREHQPSAALVKAALVNGARWVTGTDAVHDHAKEPNYHQGFGRVFLPWTIPNASVPAMQLEFVDNWENPADAFSSVGDARQYLVTVGPDSWLRLCLVWTDPPGRGLQHNLNLLLEHSNSGTKWVGNQNRPTQLPTPDPGNNVQVIRIDEPGEGSYLVQVVATNLLRDPQPFALVVAGGLRSGLAEI